MESFEKDCREVPYVLGALFAVYEQVQRLANPDLNATIHDRYFSLAQTMPHVAFRQLDKLAAVHLRQLKRRDAKRANMLQNEIKKLWMSLPTADPPIPHRFEIDDANKFILGYYLRRNWTKKPDEDMKGEATNE